MMLWQRPGEAAIRAVATLAQVAGAQRVRAAREMVDEQVRKRLKPSRALVDHSADGDVDKMLLALRDLSLIHI